MRQPLTVIVLGLLLLAGVGVVPVSAATGPTGAAAVATSDATAPEPKVVIIVGPVEGTTSSYRADADEAYAEARRYTSDVTKIYSPNATWAKVKAAVTGASIVVYLGHGNGWPSPYTYDAKYTTKDGFGLNAAAGQGDSNNTYYGEPSVSTLAFAPNAVVILNHLCYASGNSEPGNADPSQSVARQRVDNFGAAFLKAGAGAVIADGHGSAAPYIAAILSTDTSIEDAWRSAPNAHGHEASFASSRTKGATAYTDTDSASAGFYRSLVTRPGLTTTDVRGGAGATVVKPSSSSGTPFVDIASSKFKADIVWLYGSGITSGCAANLFCPTGQVTRGQMASFLARALDLPAATKDYFSDDRGSSHERDINKVAAAGLTSGCGTRRFCPDTVVSRAQMATFLAKALALPSTSHDYFRDDDSSVHERNINRVAKADLTRGCAADRYCPSNAVTRGQMAAFLHRAFGD